MAMWELFAFTNSHCFGKAFETTSPQFLRVYFIKNTENKNIYISYIARNKCFCIKRIFSGMKEPHTVMGSFNIIEVFKIWQAKPFEIANIIKRPDCLLQMDAFPNMTLVKKGVFELQERSKVKETTLLPKNRSVVGRKCRFHLRAKMVPFYDD